MQEQPIKRNEELGLASIKLQTYIKKRLGISIQADEQRNNSSLKIQILPEPIQHILKINPPGQCFLIPRPFLTHPAPSICPCQTMQACYTAWGRLRLRGDVRRFKAAGIEGKAAMKQVVGVG